MDDVCSWRQAWGASHRPWPQERPPQRIVSHLQRADPIWKRWNFCWPMPLAFGGKLENKHWGISEKMFSVHLTDGIYSFKNTLEAGSGGGLRDRCRQGPLTPRSLSCGLRKTERSRVEQTAHHLICTDLHPPVMAVIWALAVWDSH